MIDNHFPALWTTVKLGDVLLDMQPGFAMRPGRSDRGVPQLRTNNVSPEGTLDLSEVKHVAASPAEIEKYAVRRGDVIFNNTNSVEWVGKTALFDSDEAFVLSNHMTRLRTNEELLIPGFLTRYLHYLWKTGVVRRWTKQWVNQAAIDQAALAQFQVPLPPLLEQTRIVTLLQQADDLRLLRRQADENAQKLLSALFHEMFGDPIKLQSGWKEKGLSEFVEINSSLVDPTQPEYADLVHVGSDNIEGETGRLINLSSVQTRGTISGNFLFTNEHILYSKIRPALKKVATPDFTGLCSADIYPLTFDKNQVTKLFLAQLLRSEHFTLYTARVSGRAQIPKVNREDLLRYRSVIPDLDTQIRFERRAQEFFATQQCMEQSATNLNALFESLLAQAFIGELTAQWREKHADELRKAVTQRDAALGLQAERQEPVTPIQEYAPESLARWAQRPVLAELDEFTQRLLRSAESKPAYFRAEDLSQDGAGVVETEESLRLLSALGFVRQVQVRGQLRYRLIDPVNERALPEESQT